MAAFDLSMDAEGVMIIAREGWRCPSCADEQAVSRTIAELRAELETLETRMKRLVRERQLVDPFAPDAEHG